MTAYRDGEWYLGEDSQWRRWPDPTPYKDPPIGGDLPPTTLPWHQRRPLLAAAALLTLAGGVYAGRDRIASAFGHGPTLDGTGIENAIEDSYADRGVTLHAHCPNRVPNRRGKIIDCDVEGFTLDALGITYHHVRVTLQDTDGHFELQPY